MNLGRSHTRYAAVLQVGRCSCPGASRRMRALCATSWQVWGDILMFTVYKQPADLRPCQQQMPGCWHSCRICSTHFSAGSLSVRQCFGIRVTAHAEGPSCSYASAIYGRT